MWRPASRCVRSASQAPPARDFSSLTALCRRKHQSPKWSSRCRLLRGVLPQGGAKSRVPANTASGGLQRRIQLQEFSELVVRRVQERRGYSLDLAPSAVGHPGAGDGVWLRGSAEAGAVVGLYPGVVYTRAHYRRDHHLRNACPRVGMAGQGHMPCVLSSIELQAPCSVEPVTPAHVSGPMAASGLCNS